MLTAKCIRMNQEWVLTQTLKPSSYWPLTMVLWAQYSPVAISNLQPM
jgi:hypothetical protein